jgi:hypothetical protein
MMVVILNVWEIILRNPIKRINCRRIAWCCVETDSLILDGGGGNLITPSV